MFIFPFILVKDFFMFQVQPLCIIKIGNTLNIGKYVLSCIVSFR